MSLTIPAFVGIAVAVLGVPLAAAVESLVGVLGLQLDSSASFLPGLSVAVFQGALLTCLLKWLGKEKDPLEYVPGMIAAALQGTCLAAVMATTSFGGGDGGPIETHSLLWCALIVMCGFCVGMVFSALVHRAYWRITLSVASEYAQRVGSKVAGIRQARSQSEREQARTTPLIRGLAFLFSYIGGYEELERAAVQGAAAGVFSGAALFHLEYASHSFEASGNIIDQMVEEGIATVVGTSAACIFLGIIGGLLIDTLGLLLQIAVILAAIGVLGFGVTECAKLAFSH